MTQRDLAEIPLMQYNLRNIIIFLALAVVQMVVVDQDLQIVPLMNQNHHLILIITLVIVVLKRIIPMYALISQNVSVITIAAMTAAVTSSVVQIPIEVRRAALVSVILMIIEFVSLITVGSDLL